VDEAGWGVRDSEVPPQRLFFFVAPI
jgi:hypothetical protein